MREAGYTTHYFGKWHVSNPPEHSLDRYGFDDWEESYPEPHGAAAQQSGRLSRRRLHRPAPAPSSAARPWRLELQPRPGRSKSGPGPYANGPDTGDIPPWFAVASFTNPHDIATYPAVIAQALPADDPEPITIGDKTIPPTTQSIFGPLTVPARRATARRRRPTAGTIQIPLNPLGFPQDCTATRGEGFAHPERGPERPSPAASTTRPISWAWRLNAKTGFNIVDGLSPPRPQRSRRAAARWRQPAGARQSPGEQESQAAAKLALEGARSPSS